MWRLDTRRRHLGGQGAVRRRLRGGRAALDRVPRGGVRRGRADTAGTTDHRRRGVRDGRRPAGPGLRVGGPGCSRPDARPCAGGCCGRRHPPGRARARGRDRPVVRRADRCRPLGRAGRAAARRGSPVRGPAGRPARRAGGAGVVARAAAHRSGCATATCGPTTCCRRPMAASASSTGRTAAPPIPHRSSAACCSSSARNDPGRARSLAAAYAGERRAGPGRASWRLLDADRAARAHHRDRRPGLAGAQSPVTGAGRLRGAGSPRCSTSRTRPPCSTGLLAAVRDR